MFLSLHACLHQPLISPTQNGPCTFKPHAIKTWKQTPTNPELCQIYLFMPILTTRYTNKLSCTTPIT